MKNQLKFYIDGQWVDPVNQGGEVIDVINPATEQPFTKISAANAADIDHAVAAARKAFEHYALWSVEQRLDLLERILQSYDARREDIAKAITQEMGAPIDLARGSQSQSGRDHLQSAIRALKNFQFETIEEDMILRHEPIGVCGMITPWNWPVNQIFAKIAPALAAGCTMVLKPSEESPLDAIILTEVMDQAGVPAGVFNMVHGYGPVAGEAMSAHPDIDMMSFTGSTRGGIAVAKAAASTVKRVGQELGGKSANIILNDTNIADAVTQGIHYCMENSGQSCNAPSRMLVPDNQMQVAIEAARQAAESIRVDNPAKEGNHLGPVVNRTQFEKIQRLIQIGIDEGATLVAGGTGKPGHLDAGYYCKPTVFANVNNDMTIAREEIFGPVIAIMGYENEDHAVHIANDTEYGLCGYVSSENMEHAKSIARKIRAGQIAINYIDGTADTPFGGYKRSGNGRENGRWGLQEFLEVKAITGSMAS